MKKTKKATKKKTTKATTPAASKPTSLPALASWLASPAGKRVAAALERAASPTNPEHRASVAIGRRRVEIRRTPKGYDAIDPKTGEPIPYVARARGTGRRRILNDETPAQAKRRYVRELDRDERKRAAKARKEQAAAVTKKAQATRKERSKALETARTACKTDREQARAVKGPPRRVAAAKARTRCAGRALSIEQRFGRELAGLRRDLDELKAARKPARPRRPSRPSTATTARERRSERDDAISAELTRRGLAHLIPIWLQEKDGPSLRALTFDRAIERFLEGISEREELVTLAQEQAEQAIANTAECEQADFYARQGDPQAALFHGDNCDEDNRPRRRTSAADRTMSMFGGIAPPKVTAERPRRGRRGKTPTVRGQQTIGVGRFGAPLLDTPRDQISF